ncbi:MAG: hypothetical protein HC849_03815 [Oscillatoriales cyanobacterium RU_3_3]|nr:hypothetical protein [Microcoleus sp. SU_5_6]NJL66417.1 hypothetical protein [Microcoleus sp. SM1_3_4]NJM59502.1 hypothetical protein [Oscillatoriales cyanobacterium RU_3_3]NJR23165.1 hypothetical protein [Richelia sp. CSU_2_1]
MTITRVSVDSAGNQEIGRSFEPSFSADGRFVAFTSDASNLVPGDTLEICRFSIVCCILPANTSLLLKEHD